MKISVDAYIQRLLVSYENDGLLHLIHHSLLLRPVFRSEAANSVLVLWPWIFIRLIGVPVNCCPSPTDPRSLLKC